MSSRRCSARCFRVFSSPTSGEPTMRSKHSPNRSAISICSPNSERSINSPQYVLGDASVRSSPACSKMRCAWAKRAPSSSPRAMRGARPTCIGASTNSSPPRGPTRTPNASSNACGATVTRCSHSSITSPSALTTIMPSSKCGSPFTPARSANRTARAKARKRTPSCSATFVLPICRNSIPSTM